LIEGNAVQLIYQIGGVAIVLIYDGVVSLIILKLIDRTLGLRVTDDEETIGLDLTLHGEAVQ
jgi:ammonium transporter, Amt family